MSADRLIFGDTAGLAVNRNITVELDRGALYVGHGNEAHYESFSPSHKFEGTWQHLAIVFEQPRSYLYMNGALQRIWRAGDTHLAHPGGWPVLSAAGGRDTSRASSTKSGSTTAP